MNNDQTGLIGTEERKIGKNTFLISKIPASYAEDIMITFFKDVDMDSVKAVGSGNQKAVKSMLLSGSFETTTLPMLKWVCVKAGPSWIRLSSREMIDAHIDSVEDILLLKGEMVAINFLSSKAGGPSPS